MAKGILKFETAQQMVSQLKEGVSLLTTDFTKLKPEPFNPRKVGTTDARQVMWGGVLERRNVRTDLQIK